MPIAKLEVMPFRDAGNGVFDHALSIQVSCPYFSLFMGECVQARAD
jgi:hypothetical protein